MTSPAKIASNRNNARRSTGPKTAHGKARSARNSLQHGLLSKLVVLPDEDAAEFMTFYEGMNNALAPNGQMEDVLAERVLANSWRLRRVYGLEARAFEYMTLDARVDAQRAATVWAHLDGADEAMEAADATAAERDADFLMRGLFRDAKDADVLGKLSRYETTLARGMFRAYHELQRLQASRAGQTVLPPAVLDVNVTSNQR